jgi:hypothetical protein
MWSVRERGEKPHLGNNNHDKQQAGHREEQKKKRHSRNPEPSIKKQRALLHLPSCSRSLLNTAVPFATHKSFQTFSRSQ